MICAAVIEHNLDLIGGAVGDALGYAVEFLQDYQIFKRYGENGITEYSFAGDCAPISDDTQMTLFTAVGLFVGTTRGKMRGIMGSYPSYLSFTYKDWLKTQLVEEGEISETHSSWLNNVPALNSRRAPGNTCLSACSRAEVGTIEHPINISKGCGGVMRVAPIGLYFEGKNYSSDEIDMIGAQAAALTHGHEFGYIPAAALVHIIHLVSHNSDITLLDAVISAKEAITKLFPQSEYSGELINLIDKAIRLSGDGLDDLEAIRELGEDWVAEENLAIAIYCALKYSNDFEKAIIASVNHSGDSDSTGAVTGNILGAYLGLSAIPGKFLDKLELKDIITEIADDLYFDCRMSEYGEYHDEKWVEKYIKFTYKAN